LVFMMGDGRIVVCNGMDQTIRFFDSEGIFIKQTGGEGDGPGEFRGKSACLPSGSGFVAYGRPGIVVWFDEQGDPVKTARIPTIDGRFGGLSGVFSDGSFLISGNVSAWSARELGPGLHTSTQDVFVTSADGDSVNNLFTMGIQNNACSTERCLRQLFGPTGQLLPNDDEFFFGWPDSYEIGVADKTGRVLRKIRKAWDPPPVSTEDRQWWEETSRERDSEWHLDIMILPDLHTAFDRLYVDRVNNLWVRHRHPRYYNTHEFLGVRFPYAWTWDVFDPTGRWMTTLTMPVAFEIHDVGEDYILGIWRDEMDVEYVRMYSLDRGG
jgi:hypothetical protein